jgi:hypothetical protein
MNASYRHNQSVNACAECELLVYESYVFLKEFIVSMNSDMRRRAANWMCVEIMTETRKQTGGDGVYLLVRRLHW